MQNSFKALGEAVSLLLQPQLVLQHASRVLLQLLVLPVQTHHISSAVGPCGTCPYALTDYPSRGCGW